MNADRLEQVDERGPRNTRDALAVFIDQAKATLPYDGVMWDDSVWSIGTANVKARAHLSGKKQLLFTPHYGARVPMTERVPFEAPFADIVKACIVKRRLNRGIESGTQLVFLRATRYLYEALPLPVRRDVTLITRGHFVNAETACLRREKASSAYRACTFLEEFGRMLDRNSLCRAPIDFRTSAKRPTDQRDRTTAKFEERTAALPTAAALTALAELANNEELLAHPFDRLRMRIAEILFVCGFRAGEVLTLPANPLVRQFVLDEGGKLRLDATTGEPIEKIGLRYWPEKGGEPIVKWVPTVANPLILRSLADIEILCGPARKNAQWLDEHPDDVRLDVEDDGHIPLKRAAELIGVTNDHRFKQWIRQRGRGGHAMLERHGDRLSITGASLRRAIAADRYDKAVLVRPNGVRQMLGATLLTMFLWDWSANRPPNRYISMPITIQMLSDFLAGRDGMPSVFDRYGSVDDEGQPFRFRSHDFRRLVNIVAQRGGLSQVEIAQWMGRRRIDDNEAYDLRSAAEMAEEMRALVEKNEVFGTIADQVRMLPVAERAAFLSERLTMLHATPLGKCGSNIVENPCETAVSCLGGCRHYLRRKNDANSRAALLRMKQTTIEALERAREAAAAGRGNAPNWVEAQETVLRTIDDALALDDDPNLADGELSAVNPTGPNLGVPM